MNTEMERTVTVEGRTVVLKKDPVYSFWSIWNTANNKVWPEKFTTFDNAVLGAKKIFRDTAKATRVEKVKLTPRDKED